MPGVSFKEASEFPPNRALTCGPDRQRKSSAANRRDPCRPSRAARPASRRTAVRQRPGRARQRYRRAVPYASGNGRASPLRSGRRTGIRSVRGSSSPHTRLPFFLPCSIGRPDSPAKTSSGCASRNASRACGSRRSSSSSSRIFFRPAPRIAGTTRVRLLPAAHGSPPRNRRLPALRERAQEKYLMLVRALAAPWRAHRTAGPAARPPTRSACRSAAAGHAHKRPTALRRSHTTMSASRRLPPSRRRRTNRPDIRRCRHIPPRFLAFPEYVANDSPPLLHKWVYSDCIIQAAAFPYGSREEPDICGQGQPYKRKFSR